MKKFLLICSILTSHLSYGTVDSLITNNSSWKFLDNGSNQGTSWSATGFDDGSWASKNTILGYGDADTDIPTHQVNCCPVGGGNKYVTTYFRKNFNVVNPATYSSLNLSLIYDDGVVVYLNGTEISRQGMPAGTITSTTLATGDVADPNERVWTNLNISSALLIAGNNVIAVEIHQRLVTSSDIAMNLLLAANLIAPPASDSLITNYSSWKYLDNGSNQGTGWAATGFDDGSWASGITILGYGDSDTELPNHKVNCCPIGGGDKYVTTYFRKSFNVANPAAYSSLNLSLIFDDGAVVYLNGTEISRHGMPAGVIGHTTLATADIAVPNERVWTNVTISAAQLVAGINVIAVEIHQRLVTSSDIAMNLLLRGNSTPPTVTRGPYLQMLGTDRVVVRWQTATATDSKVSYGLTTGYLSPPVTNATVSTEHEISITGLTQDTKYFYQIGTTIVNIPSDAQTYFRTALPEGTTSDFTTWVTGDFGTGGAEQANVRNAYTTYAAANLPNGKADFWLWLGDNAYESGTASEFTSTLFNVYPSILKNTPVFPAVGNHDYGNHGDTFPGAPLPYPATYEYFNALTMPQNAELGGVASTTKRYYSYNYGNVHFIVLDSYGVVTNSTTNPMYTWLQADLAANTKKWTVCYFHHPPYSKGTHDSENPSEIGLIYMRQYFVPLLESYHVDLVLSGHSHVYERSFLLSAGMKVNNTMGDVPPYYTKNLVNGVGTVYAVCGVSGKGGVITPTPPGFPFSAVMARSFATLYGSMILTFKPNEIDAKFLTSTGTINDSFKIVKNACVTGVTVEESLISGDWHTTSTWGCGTIPTTDSMVKINAGHTVTLSTANTADVKNIYVFGMLRYLNNKQLRLKN